MEQMGFLCIILFISFAICPLMQHLSKTRGINQNMQLDRGIGALLMPQKFVEIDGKKTS